MAQRRLRPEQFIGRVNLLLGLATPLRVAYLVVISLRVFSFGYCSASIYMLLLLQSILGALAGLSGWGLLRERRWTWWVTSLAGGTALGYSVVGVFVMAAFREDLLIKIRNGSIHWWEWSISHFQNTPLIDALLILWWGYVFANVVFLRRGDAAPGWEGKAPAGAFISFGWAILGGIVRILQMGVDLSNYSQR